MWQWGGLKQATFPCDEKIFLPPHDRHKDMSRCYFKGKGFGGKRGAGGTHPHQIKDLSLGLWRKKGPKSEITEPISEPPPGSHRSVTLLMPFQAPSEGRQHFTRAEPEISRASPNPSRNCSRTGWHSPLSCVLEK